MTTSAAADGRQQLVAQAARILIVDDEPRQRSSLAELVTLRGYRVDTAFNGADAVQQLAEVRFDLVLLDIRMPGMDGHAVLRSIRESGADVAVIAISGDPSTEDASRAFRAGADDYLRKPFAPEQIYAAIENSIAKRRLADENLRIKRRLEQSERLHRLIVNHSPDLMILLDARRNIRFVNQAAEFVLGYEPDKLVGRPFQSLIESEDHGRADELLSLSPDRPELRSAEMRLRPREARGRARTFELLVMPLAFQNVAGALTNLSEARGGGAYIVARDISSRLRQEAELRESRQRFRDYAELAADCLWETDTQGRFSYVSETISRCFRLPPDGLGGRDMFAALNDLIGEHPGLIEMRARIDEQSPFEVELDDLEPHHPAVSVVFSARPAFDVAGQFIGYRGVGRDVSEIRRQTRELKEFRLRLEGLVRQRTHDLEVINRELESFSASVAHDLRTPLRAIAGFSSILNQEYGTELDQRGRGFLDRIVSATARLSALIDELLGLSRVTRQSIHRQKVDLGDLGVQIDAGLRQRNPERRVVFEAARPLAVQADAGLMRIALYHLLDNAWKFTRPQGEARIALNLQMVDGQRVFVVADNGIGFDARFAAKLFRPFERLHADPQFEGNGIGLATVARIIHRHGGRVWADAAPGRGARVYFTLPDREEAMALAGRDPFRCGPPAPSGLPRNS